MDKGLAEKILNLSSDAGANAAEIYLRSYSSTTIEVKEQKVDAFDRARDIGAGLRVLVGGGIGFAFTTDFQGSALKNLVLSAITNAQNSEPDPSYSIPGKPSSGYSEYREMALYDPEIVRLSEKEKIERVMAMERIAYGVDPRIKRIRKASTGFSDAETLIVNTNGADVFFKSTVCSSGMEVVAEEKGESQAGSDFDVKRVYRQLDVETVGSRAAQRALDLLGAKQIDSVKAPVILDSTVAQEFLSLMAGSFSAENVQKKRSLFIGKLTKEVASSAITVYDDGLLESGIGTAPCDDELVPVQKNIIIDKGRLAMYLHNTYTANKDKTISTGNGMRGGFKGIPGVGITNLYIKAGQRTLEELIASLDEGLFVTEVMGMHTANAISGDFSVGAVGFWIEKGEKAYPVREITIAGNIIDLMKQVDVVGSDIRFFGRIGCPSLCVKELSIAGQ